MDRDQAVAILARFPVEILGSRTLGDSPTHGEFHDAVARLVGVAAHDHYAGDHHSHHLYLEAGIIAAIPGVEPAPVDLFGPVLPFSEWHGPHSNWLLRHARTLTDGHGSA